MDDDPAGWETVWVVARSELHAATWVPWSIGVDDLSCFMHAGPVRAVRSWVDEEAARRGRAGRRRWERRGSDHWHLLAEA